LYQLVASSGSPAAAAASISTFTRTTLTVVERVSTLIPQTYLLMIIDIITTK
jgi:hypothetical protein